MKRIGNKPLTPKEKTARHRERVAASIGLTAQQVGTLVKDGEAVFVRLTNTPVNAQEVNDLKALLPELHPYAAALLEDYIAALERLI